MRGRPSITVTGTSVASTELALNTSRSTRIRPFRSARGTMRSTWRIDIDPCGATPNTRKPSGDSTKVLTPSSTDRRQSKLPMRARSCARASLALLRSSSCRVCDARSR